MCVAVFAALLRWLIAGRKIAAGQLNADDDVVSVSLVYLWRMLLQQLLLMLLLVVVLLLLLLCCCFVPCWLGASVVRTCTHMSAAAADSGSFLWLLRPSCSFPSPLTLLTTLGCRSTTVICCISNAPVLHLLQVAMLHALFDYRARNCVSHSTTSNSHGPTWPAACGQYSFSSGEFMLVECFGFQFFSLFFFFFLLLLFSSACCMRFQLPCSICYHHLRKRATESSCMPGKFYAPGWINRESSSGKIASRILSTVSAKHLAIPPPPRMQWEM